MQQDTLSAQSEAPGLPSVDGSLLRRKNKPGAGRPAVTVDKMNLLRQETRERLWTPGQQLVGPPKQVFLPNPPAKKGTSAYKAWSMECFLELLRHGYTYSAAAEYLGYSYQWWSNLSQEQPDWAAEARSIRGGEVGKWERPDLTHMPFAEFVSEYFGVELAKHQIDIGAALDDPMARLVLILGFPEAGKSTLVSLWYVLYRLAQDPDRRIALVAKSSSRAQDLLIRVKRYLTEEQLYADAPRSLIHDFNGWKPAHGELEWSQNAIFVRHRESGERDPSIQALGIGKQIYGVRLDLLVLDDALVLDNQISETMRHRLDVWFTNEARSRTHRGQTVVNGTRLVPFDLYGQWKKSWVDNPLFRGVYVPAILHEYTEDEVCSWPERWTLDGYFEEDPPGTGVQIYRPGMRDFRKEIVARDPGRWKLVYQQEDVEESEAIFTMEHIENAFRLGEAYSVGQVFDNEILILGVDPATTGRAASVLIALDPTSRTRRVVEVFVGSNLGGAGVRRDLMYRFWDRYRDHGISYTVIETNFATTLLADEDLRRRAEAAGTVLVDHMTVARGHRRGSKWDSEYGIGALQSMFSGNIFIFPSKTPTDRSYLQPLVDDMLVFPWAKQQDALVALWVAEGEAKVANIRVVDSITAMRARGVPPNIIERARRAENATDRTRA